MRVHIVEEAIILSRRMSEGWKKGRRILSTLGDEGDLNEILDRMEEIVRNEIAVSRCLSKIIAKDGRLCYHSEVERSRYFPKNWTTALRILKCFSGRNSPRNVREPKTVFTR